MKVSVILLNWNGRKLLEKFLPSVVAHTPSDVAEVVVADNGSTDDSVAMLRERFPGGRFLIAGRGDAPEIRQAAEGYNRAIEQTTAEYTVLLNTDVEVTPGWLTAPLEELDADASVAAVQPKLLSRRDRSFFEYAGAAGGWIDRYGYPFCRGRVLSVVEEDRGQYDTPADILWASGACLFIRTDLYRRVGGLDARFFAHQEEIDLCWRLRSRGYRLRCTPQSVVFHVGGGTLHTESPYKTFLNFRNNLLMIYKNLPDRELPRVMRLRRVLDYFAALHFLLTGHAKNALAVIRARREFRRLRPAYTSVRVENLRLSTLDPIPEQMNRSLLTAFYFKGQKKFDQLITASQ